MAVASDQKPPMNQSTTEAQLDESISYADSAEQGARASVDDAATDILSGLGGKVTEITSVTQPTGTDVTVELARDNGDLENLWLANLAAGAFAELTRTDNAAYAYSEALTQATAVVPDDHGSLAAVPLGMGAARLGQLFSSPDDDQLAATVKGVASKFGLTVNDIAILHPLESALDVSLTVADKAQVDWTIGELETAITGASPNVEGLHLVLLSESREHLLTTTASYRTGNGGLTFAPGQDERFGAVHGHGPWE